MFKNRTKIYSDIEKVLDKYNLECELNSDGNLVMVNIKHKKIHNKTKSKSPLVKLLKRKRG